MQLEKLNELSLLGTVKIEMLAGDLLDVVKDVAKETARIFLAKMNEERSPEFLSRKDAMNALNVSTALTMIRWEEKGYLNPFRMGGRIFYRKDEVLKAFENFKRVEV